MLHRAYQAIKHARQDVNTFQSNLNILEKFRSASKIAMATCPADQSENSFSTHSKYKFIESDHTSNNHQILKMGLAPADHIVNIK
jgi:hypothetical protein